MFAGIIVFSGIGYGSIGWHEKADFNYSCEASEHEGCAEHSMDLMTYVNHEIPKINN